MLAQYERGRIAVSGLGRVPGRLARLVGIAKAESFSAHLCGAEDLEVGVRVVNEIRVSYKRLAVTHTADIGGAGSTSSAGTLQSNFAGRGQALGSRTAALSSLRRVARCCTYPARRAAGPVIQIVAPGTLPYRRS